MVKKKSKVVSAFVLITLSIFFGCNKDNEDESFVPPDIFPLALESGHFVTNKGEPFLITGDSPWYLIQGTDKKGVDKYLNNRYKKGINAIVLSLLASPLYGPENASGDNPFMSADDFSSPNDKYFDHAEYVIKKARDKGMAVFLYPAWLGFDDGNGHSEGFYSQIIQNGPQALHNYGEYIGRRFGKMDNIIWVMGGDSPPKDALEEIRALVAGIESATEGDPIFSVQNGRYTSGVSEYQQESWIDLNTTYSDHDSMSQHLQDDYEKDVPFYFTEGSYENTGAQAAEIRAQMYLPVLMGAIGYFYGIKPLYAFEPGWEHLLETQGSHDLQRSGAFFRSRAWNDLIPDMRSEFLKNSSEDNLLAGAITRDGTTGIVYVPRRMEVELNLALMNGTSVMAWWYNPSTGKSIEGGIFNTGTSVKFMPPADGDWLLVLDDVATNPAPPGQ